MGPNDAEGFYGALCPVEKGSTTEASFVVSFPFLLFFFMRTLFCFCSGTRNLVGVEFEGAGFGAQSGVATPEGVGLTRVLSAAQ